MPRHKRIEIEGGIYHVIQRGLERREIFRDDSDRQEFINRLSLGLKQIGHKCYGWVLMPNHFHLLIRTGERSLSDLMRKLLTGYAIYFNRKYERNGYLYQNRYKSILCQQDNYLLELVRYIHLNPLRAKIVEDINGLNKYKWSGHGVLVGENKAEWQSTGEILEHFGGKKSKAVIKYIEFISEAKDKGNRDDLSGGGLRRSAGGWEEVKALKMMKDYWRGDERILGDGDFVNEVLRVSEEIMKKRELLKREGWDINRLTEHVAKIIGITKDEILKKRKHNKAMRAKGLISYWGRQKLGLNGKQIGDFLGITKQAVSYLVMCGEKLVKEKNYNLSI